MRCCGYAIGGNVDNLILLYSLLWVWTFFEAEFWPFSLRRETRLKRRNTRGVRSWLSNRSDWTRRLRHIVVMKTFWILLVRGGGGGSTISEATVKCLGRWFLVYCLCKRGHLDMIIMLVVYSEAYAHIYCVETSISWQNINTSGESERKKKKKKQQQEVKDEATLVADKKRLEDKRANLKSDIEAYKSRYWV